MACASTSELAAAETQLGDASPSLNLEGGALVPDSKPADHPTVVLAVLCVAQFLSALDVFIVNVALRKIGVGVGASSLSDLSWVLNAYAIVIAALLIPAGRIADLFGRKRGFLLGLGVFVIASVGAAASSSLSMLIGFRVLQAAGAAALIPTSLGLLIVAAPPEKREFHVKIWTASAALAAASGPVIGGLLVQLSWRWIFLVNIPVGLAAIAVAARFVPDVKRQLGARLPDLIGSLLLVIAIASLALGLVRAPYWGWTGTRTPISFAVSAVALPAFVWRSARHPAPVLDLNLLRSRVLSSASASSLLYFASFGILLLSSVLWIQGHWHYSAIKTGLSIAPGPCLVPIFATLSELLTKRIRVGVIAASGCVVSAVGAALLLSSMGQSPAYVADFLPGWLLVCIGFALAMPTVLAAGTAELPHEQSATGSAVVNMAVQVGLVLGISILVAVLGTASAGAGLHLFRTAWWIAVGSVLIAGVAALMVTPRGRRLSADRAMRTATASGRRQQPNSASISNSNKQQESNMNAITRGSVTEPHELGGFIDDEKSASGRSSATPGRGLYRPTLPRRAAFWLLAAVLCLLFVATAAPAPLYGVYQAEWHFSVTTLTAVFAVYAFVLLVTLLMFGSVSDYFGRRRTIVAGLVAYGMACGVFLAAGDVAALFVARALQGVAVGLATGALGAAMLELQPEGSGLAPPVTSAAGPLGLAIGGFGASALVQYGPARTHLVWWLLLGAGLALVVAVLAVPESGARRSRTRPSFRPRLRVPLEARGVFVVALPCLIGAWALSGFYLSLGPSLAAQLLRSQNLLWGGVVIALLFGVGVPITLAARNSTSSKVMLGGCVALFTGAAITFVAIATRTSALLLAGTAVAGLGWGPAFLGAYGTIVALASPEDRAGIVAAIFTVGYLAFSIPAVIAGVATSHYGLHKTALVYSSIVAVLAATAAASVAVRRTRAGRAA